MIRELKLVGNLEIRQFKVEQSGLYAWRHAPTRSDWVFGYLDAGNQITGQYEGCGPITFDILVSEGLNAA